MSSNRENSLSINHYREWLVVFIGLCALFVPTIRELATSLWISDDQAHGAIIFSVSLWLIYRKREILFSGINKPNNVLGGLFFFLGLSSYLIGRSQNIIQLETGSLIVVLAALLLIVKGAGVLKKLWFPLFFLLFAIPLPGALVQALTLPLKIAVSHVAEIVLYGIGYPIARTGVVLSIGQYQLLVADACAGLNSIFTLEALGLLYLNLCNHEKVARTTMLAILVVPISFTANVIRVMTLVLITYYFGDAAGQGFAHKMAGMILFIVGLILIISVDTLLGRFLFSDLQPARGAHE